MLFEFIPHVLICKLTRYLRHAKSHSIFDIKYQSGNPV